MEMERERWWRHKHTTPIPYPHPPSFISTSRYHPPAILPQTHSNEKPTEMENQNGTGRGREGECHGQVDWKRQQLHHQQRHGIPETLKRKKEGKSSTVVVSEGVK